MADGATKMVFSVFARAAVANRSAVVMHQARDLMVVEAAAYEGSKSLGSGAFSHARRGVNVN